MLLEHEELCAILDLYLFQDLDHSLLAEDGQCVGLAFAFKVQVVDDQGADAEETSESEPFLHIYYELNA